MLIHRTLKPFVLSTLVPIPLLKCVLHIPISSGDAMRVVVVELDLGRTNGLSHAVTLLIRDYQHLILSFDSRVHAKSFWLAIRHGAIHGRHWDNTLK